MEQPKGERGTTSQEVGNLLLSAAPLLKKGAPSLGESTEHIKSSLD